MQPAKQKRTEEGLTLMESLVGIMVIAIVLTAITPPMLIAFASRVQNYRASQAMKIAQGEIERVRLVVEQGSYGTNWTYQLPPSRGQTAQTFNLDDVVGAPDPDYKATAKECPNLEVKGDTQVTSWCKVDINEDGSWDLAVQTFRSSTPPLTYDLAKKQDIAFLMGVRVYTRAAIQGGRLDGFPRRKTASLGLTAGEAISLPLVTRYEPIVRSDLDISRFAYCELNNKINDTSIACN